MRNGVVTKKIPFITWVFILFLAVFFYNFFIFLNTDGNTHPLVGSLFNMIIALFIFFFVFHKEDLKEEKKRIIDQNYQTNLDKYFKIFK